MNQIRVKLQGQTKPNSKTTEQGTEKAIQNAQRIHQPQKYTERPTNLQSYRE